MSAVTGHNDEGQDITPEARRKRESRERARKMGIKVIEPKLSATERALLDEVLSARGYEITEYVATLIRQDHARLQEQLATIRAERCERCGLELPRGCLQEDAEEGEREGEAGCWRTYNARRLSL